MTVSGDPSNHTVTSVFPSSNAIDDAVPSKPREYLSQAVNSLHAPAGAVILAGSAVDAMLKIKGYEKGSLYTRINSATKDSLITKDMGKWAHQVRLEANDQRHADKEAELPTRAEAEQSIRFAVALAEFIFVLPSRVNEGLQESVSAEASAEV